MKDIYPNSHCKKCNGTVEMSDLKLKIYKFSQETLNFEWQSRSINLTLKMWYISAFKTNIPIKNEKVNILT